MNVTTVLHLVGQHRARPIAPIHSRTEISSARSSLTRYYRHGCRKIFPEKPNDHSLLAKSVRGERSAFTAARNDIGVAPLNIMMMPCVKLLQMDSTDISPSHLMKPIVSKTQVSHRR
jgi:hypothetical protein